MRKSQAPSSTKRMRTTVTKAPVKRIPRQLATVNLGKAFPMKIQITHRYSALLTVTSTAGAVTTYKFACNGLYDPDLTSSGHQPYYFDQMAALYNHYTVLTSSITVSAVPTTATQNSMICALAYNDDTTVGNAGLVQYQIEQPGGKYALLANGCNQPQIMRGSFDAKKIFGGDPMSIKEIQGTSAANPTEIYCYILTMQTCDGATTSNALYVVDMQFTAVWDELKDVTAS